MDRAQLQQLAELRVKDAEALLDSGRWAASYYLLGYSLECALKACIAKQFREHEVPDRRLVNSFYTHRLDELLAISRLGLDFDARGANDLHFRDNWEVACRWNETARYDLLVSAAAARELYRAVTDAATGILPWLITQW
jgi:hypothetical protein